MTKDEIIELVANAIFRADENRSGAWQARSERVRENYRHMARAAISSMGGLGERLKTEFLPAILHGDDRHQAWLRAAVDAFLAGEPIPAASGSGSADAARKQALEEAAKVARDYAPGLQGSPLWTDAAKGIATAIEALIQPRGEG